MIIGIAGYKGAGKDTAGSVLVKKYGFIQLSFAKPIKDLVSKMFSLDRDMLEGNTIASRLKREQKIEDAFNYSGRDLLQIIGTGMRDIIHQDIWVEAVKKLCDINKNYVITDVRFPNEVTMINQNGFVIGVKRFGYRGDTHISERALDNTALPYIVQNDGSMQDLRNKVDALVGPKLR